MRTVRVLPSPRPATRNLSLFDSNGGGKTPIGLPKWARLHALKGTGALFKYHRVGIGPCHMLVTEIIVQIVFVAVRTLFLVLAHLPWCTMRTKPHHCRFFVNLGSSRHQNVVRKCADRAGLFSNVHETQSRTLF